MTSKPIFKKPSNTDWILYASVQDTNYDWQLPRLSDEELEFCLKHEDRVSSIRRLMAEKRRREKRRCPHCGKSVARPTTSPRCAKGLLAMHIKHKHRSTGGNEE